MSGNELDCDKLKLIISKHLPDSIKLVSVGEPSKMGEGQGFVSDLYRLPVKFDETTQNNSNMQFKNVLVKCVNLKKAEKCFNEIQAAGQGDANNSSDQRLDKEMIYGIHRNECFSYEYLSSIQSPSLLLPKCFYSQLLDTEELPAMLILEDLSPFGKTVHIFNGLNIDQLKSIINQIAIWQSASLKLEGGAQSLSNDFRKLSIPELALFKPAITGAFLTLKEMFPELFDGIRIENIDQINNAEEWFKAWYVQEEGIPQVVCHGDLWTNNIIMEKNENVFTDNLIGIIDWQCAHIGSMVEDLCLLLMWHVDYDVRISYEEELIKYLVDQVKFHLGVENKHLLNDVSISELYKNYKKIAKYQLLSGMMMLQLLTSESSDPRVETWATRFANGFKDCVQQSGRF